MTSSGVPVGDTTLRISLARCCSGTASNEEGREVYGAVMTLVEAAQRHVEDEAADVEACYALVTAENLALAQQHQRETRQRANKSFGVLSAALAPFVGEATDG